MDQDTEDRLSWLWLLLIASVFSLFFQLFPGAWWAVVSILDIRSWTWRAYAAICAVGIVVLVAVRAWQNSRDNR